MVAHDRATLPPVVRPGAAGRKPFGTSCRCYRAPWRCDFDEDESAIEPEEDEAPLGELEVDAGGAGEGEGRRRKLLALAALVKTTAATSPDTIAIRHLMSSFYRGPPPSSAPEG